MTYAGVSTSNYSLAAFWIGTCAPQWPGMFQDFRPTWGGGGGAVDAELEEAAVKEAKSLALQKQITLAKKK